MFELSQSVGLVVAQMVANLLIAGFLLPAQRHAWPRLFRRHAVGRSCFYCGDKCLLFFIVSNQWLVGFQYIVQLAAQLLHGFG